MSENQPGSTLQPTGKPIRPVLIASEHTVSDYSIFLEHFLVGLADESVIPALVCPPNSDIESLVSPAVEIIRHPAFNLPLMWQYNKKVLTEQLEKFKPTVLHCLCESKALLTRQLAQQLDLPYILTVNSLQRRFSRSFISLSGCAKIIVPAKTIADNIAQVYPRFAEQIEQINIGTFVGETSNCFRNPSLLASMVTAHPLDKAADFEKLLAAVRHLAINGYEFMLIIIGGGRAERQLRRELHNLGLSQIVTIVPRLERWRHIFAACDIFIQPRPTESFNPLLLEAMSVGAAAAACKGGVDDLIIDGQTAVVFDPDDELSIMGTLKQLLDKREQTQQLAKNAQNYLRQNHTVSRMISSLLQVYRTVQNEPSIADDRGRKMSIEN